MADDGNTNNIVFETLKYLAGLIVGIFSAWYYIRKENRQIILKKRVSINRLGFTAGYQDWGNIELIYDGQPSNNINFIVVEIINDTNKDCDPLLLEFALAQNCVIYKQKAQYTSNGVVKELLQEPTAFNYFQDVRNRVNQVRTQIPPNNLISPELQLEINYVTRHRKFVVDALNRNSKVVIQIIGENNLHNAIEQVDVTADIFKKGIRVVPILDEEAHEKRKKQFVGIISLLLFLGISYPIYRYSNAVSIAVIAMIVNIFVAYYVSFPIYAAIKWFKKEFF
jgi:hypothetical protein